MESKMKRQVLDDNIKKILTFIEDNSLETFSSRFLLEGIYKNVSLEDTFILVNGKEAILWVYFSRGDYFKIDKNGVVERRHTSRIVKDCYEKDVTEDWRDNFTDVMSFDVLEDAIEAFCVQWKEIKKRFLKEVKVYTSIFDFKV